MSQMHLEMTVGFSLLYHRYMDTSSTGNVPMHGRSKPERENGAA